MSRQDEEHLSSIAEETGVSSPNASSLQSEFENL